MLFERYSLGFNEKLAAVALKSVLGGLRSTVR